VPASDSTLLKAGLAVGPSLVPFLETAMAKSGPRTTLLGAGSGLRVVRVVTTVEAVAASSGMNLKLMVVPLLRIPVL